MTGAAPERPAPERPARVVAGLLAGLLGLDLVMNAAALEVSRGAGGVARSLLAPSIDLLVVAAALMGVSRAGARSQAWLRALVAALGVLLLVLRAGLRFAWAAPGGAAGWVMGAAAAAACGAALYVLSLPVVRGLAIPVARSETLLAIALGAEVQVLLARAVFTPSVVPTIVRQLLAGR